MMTGQGCAVCRVREEGGLTWAAQLRSPTRLHVETEAALGLELARRVLARKPGFPFRWPNHLKLSLLASPNHDRTRCLARQLLDTHTCPMRRARQWPTIVTPVGPGPAS